MLPRICYGLRFKYLLATLAGLYVLGYLGVFTHIFEHPFRPADFVWPVAGDVQRYAQQKRHGQQPDVPPLDQHNHTFLKACAGKCRTPDGGLLTPRLVFVVKSALRNFGRRQAIRSSWGFEKRLSDVLIRTVFVLGRPAATEAEPLAVQHMLDVESEQFGDLVQADFADAYFNNTLKTMAGLRWAVTQCPRSQFYMFVDDDYYVSAKNVLRFLRNPVNYPEYLEEADETLRKLARRLSQSDQLPNGTALEEAAGLLAANDAASSALNRQYVKQIRRIVDAAESEKRVAAAAKAAAEVERSGASQRHLMEMELAENVRLFSGFVFATSSPHRHRSSKWYISLEEYPWHQWPPYVTAGAFVLSREALVQMYYMSMYTKHFR